MFVTRYGSGFSETNVTKFGLSARGSNNHTGYKFSQDVIWVREDAGKVDIWVERLDTSACASISYHTEDGPRGREGINYIAASGRLTFEPGEARKEITVHVVPDDINYTRARFHVRLNDDSGQLLASATVFVHDSISRTVAAVSFIYDSRIFQTFLGAAIVFSILMPPLQLLYVSKSHDSNLQVAYTFLFGLFLLDMLLHSWARWPLGYLFTTGFGMDLLHLAGVVTLLDWLVAPIREDRVSMPLDSIYLWEERRFMWGQVARTMKITLLMAQFSDLTFHLAQWVILQKKRARVATQSAIQNTRSRVKALRLHYGPQSLRWLFLSDRQAPSSNEDRMVVISEERQLLAQPTRVLLLLVESIVSQVVRLVTLVAVVVVIVTLPPTRLQDRGLLVLATAASLNTTSASLVGQLAGSSYAALPFADDDNFVSFNSRTTDLVFLKVDGRQVDNFTDYARLATLRPWFEIRAYGYNTTSSGFARCNVTISKGIVASVEDDCDSASIYDATRLIHDLAQRFLLLAVLLIGLSLLGIFFLLLDVLASRVSPLLLLLSHARMLRAAIEDMLDEWKKFIQEQDACEDQHMSTDAADGEGHNSPAADIADAESSIFSVRNAPTSSRQVIEATGGADRSQLALARWRLATRAALRSKSTFNAVRFLQLLQARYEIIAGRPLRLLIATLQDAQSAFALPISQQRRHLLHARAYYESKVTPVLHTLARHLDSGTLTREHLATAAQAVVPRFSFSPAPGSKLSRMLNVATAVVDFMQVNLLAAADSLDRQVRETLKLQESNPVTSSCIEDYALTLVRPRIRRKLSTVGVQVSHDFDKFNVSQLSREILSAAKQRIAQRLEAFELDVPDWYWESTSSGLAANVERVLVENALRRLEQKGVAVPVEMQRSSRDVGALRQSLEAQLCRELEAKLSSHAASAGSLGYEDLSWLLISSVQSEDPIAALLLTIKACLSKGCLPGQIVQRTSVRAKLHNVITTACSNTVQGSRLQRVLEEQLSAQKLDAGTLSHVLSQQAEVISMLSEAINEGVSKDSARRASHLLQQAAAIFKVIEEHSLGTTVDATSRHLLNLPFLAEWGVPLNPMSTVNIPLSFEEVCGNDSALRELLELPVVAEATAVVLFRALVRMGFIVEVGQRLSASHRFGAFWRSCWQNMW
eukprot:jgi/Chlat1/5284/Chrsp35S05192